MVLKGQFTLKEMCGIKVVLCFKQTATKGTYSFSSCCRSLVEKILQKYIREETLHKTELKFLYHLFNLFALVSHAYFTGKKYVFFYTEC